MSNHVGTNCLTLQYINIHTLTIKGTVVLCSVMYNAIKCSSYYALYYYSIIVMEFLRALLLCNTVMLMHPTSTAEYRESTTNPDVNADCATGTIQYITTVQMLQECLQVYIYKNWNNAANHIPISTCITTYHYINIT